MKAAATALRSVDDLETICGIIIGFAFDFTDDISFFFFLSKKKDEPQKRLLKQPHYEEKQLPGHRPVLVTRRTPVLH